jgi:pilus assembly protein CpaE
LGKGGDLLLELADSIYLVTQVDVPSLRNANRLIAYMDRMGNSQRRVEVVLNRFDPRRTEIDDERIVKALARPLQWKIPNDFSAIRRSENTGVPIALENSPVSRMLHQMARAACGKISDHKKKKRFGLF